jgi:signal transduction histidine kinase/serine phosphatase RsbU (regulator of sigma subunit)
MSDTTSPDELQRRLEYYKRELDKLAGENLKKDYAISSARQEIKQKRAGIALLTQLQQSLGAGQETTALFKTTMMAINGSLGMARTIVLFPTSADHVYRPALWTGFTEEGRHDEFVKRMEVTELEFPAVFATGTGHLLVNKATESTPLIQRIRDTFALPFFVCVPVHANERTIGLILTGRIKEVAPAAHPLNEGDVETLAAIAGLISNVVENMRIAVLEETNRLKTDFFANISHEFRTPITLTLGPIGALLAGRYGAVSGPAVEQLQIVQRNQERLLGLVNQILDIAKLEAGKMELKAARAPELNRFVAQRVQQFQSMAEKRGIELRSCLAPEVDAAEIYIDAEKLDKVLFNLLSNSHKFTKQGFIEVTTEIRDGQFVLAVADSGIGIRTEQLPHIFDRFRQADGSASREYAGTGIGLALVKELVELHGGTVAVRSEYGKGTTLACSLPLGHAHLSPSSIVEWLDDDAVPLARALDVREGAEDAAAGDGEAAANRDTEATLDPDKPTVLYVDDNRDLRHYVKGFLAEKYNVYLAVDGQAGLDAARRYRPELILSDLMMPVLNGTAFCARVRADPTLAGTPFVLLTAKSSLDAKIAGLEEGADDYLSKPFSEPELLARIKNLIALRHEQQRVKHELAAARSIQQSLLPPMPATVSAVDLDALYCPSEELSGDFFDHIHVDDWLYIYLADVTSHGTAAAQVTYLVKGLFQEALRRSTRELPDVMAFVQRRYEQFSLGYDVALQLGRIHLGDLRLEYLAANAPPCIRVSSGDVQPIAVPPSPFLTSRPILPATNDADMRARYRFREVALAPGDYLYLYTDGCYEFDAGGKPFGSNRFVRLLRELPDDGWGPAALERLSAVRTPAAFADDLTIVRLRIRQQ